jgi:cytochrome b pre-mRNA-processing protein 3|tara:strand:- start:266 stop:733 length:468 start_codon:yes stop_codon:yes gene_type:complete
MNNNYLNIYNNLVNLTRNKDLYKDLIKQDIFSDRLIFFLLHFAFFLKNYKISTDKKILQEIFDYCFKQLELSIREIGYGDQSINKRMKNYINLFYSILDKIDNWENENPTKQKEILSNFLDKSLDMTFLTIYFEKYRVNLENNTLNSYIKGVIKP